MKVDLYTQTGEKHGQVELPKEVFETEVNAGLLHQMLILQQSNARIGTAKTKTRGERKGGGRKPWRQKGTGRARVGSSRTPIWRKGGIIFGPTGQQNFEKMMPKKQRRKALFMALSQKANDNDIIVLEKYEVKEPKTKDFAALLAKLPLERKTLIVLSEKNPIIEKSARNLPEVKTLLVNYLNVQDLFKYKKTLFLQSALPRLQEIFITEKQ